MDNIRIIYHLLKERKMKIEVARKYIRDYRKEVDRDAEITEHLMNIRAILLEIKQDLAYGGAVVDDDCDEEPVAVPQQSGRETVGKGDEAGETDTGTKTGTAAAADRAPESAAQPTGGDPGESGETGPCHGGYQTALRGTGTLRGGRSAGTDAGGKNGRRRRVRIGPCRLRRRNCRRGDPAGRGA